MSFIMTTEAVRNRTKTVTRRLGWWNLKPGDMLQAVEKGMGLKKDEKVVRLGLIEVRDVECQSLNDILADYEGNEGYGWDEVRKEGFPDLSPYEFVQMFCKANKCGPGIAVNRIEFEYVDEEAEGE